MSGVPDRAARLACQTRSTPPQHVGPHSVGFQWLDQRPHFGDRNCPVACRGNTGRCVRHRPPLCQWVCNAAGRCIRRQEQYKRPYLAEICWIRCPGRSRLSSYRKRQSLAWLGPSWHRWSLPKYGARLRGCLGSLWLPLPKRLARAGWPNVGIYTRPRRLRESYIRESPVSGQAHPVAIPLGQWLGLAAGLRHRHEERPLRSSALVFGPAQHSTTCRSSTRRCADRHAMAAYVWCE